MKVERVPRARGGRALAALLVAVLTVFFEVFLVGPWLIVAGAAGAGGGCASLGGAGSSAPDVDAPAQVARGQQLFNKSCAGCHGSLGLGSSKGPAVVGRFALPLDPPPRARHRRTRFATALDVYEFVRTNMPPNDPSSLSESDRVAVVAYQLSSSGIEIGRRPLTVDSLAQLSPRR